MRVRRSVGAIATAAVLAVAGCGTTDAPPATDAPSAPESTSSTADPADPAASAPQGDERGAVLSDVVLGQVDQSVTALGATAHRISYRSTSGLDGSGVEVTGTVFVPGGLPPAGGWPVVSVAHGTTGVTDECAPSLYPNLLGAIGMVTPFLERGAVVAVTDYQGLGSPGPHPYLDAPSAGYDVVDAVRAARNVVPGTGTRWAAIGVSQGGQATWAANEMAADYGDGLELVGTANLSPAADLRPIAPPEGLDDLTLPQRGILPFVVEGFLVSHPQYRDSDFLSGGLLAGKDVLLACTGPLAAEKLTAVAAIGPDDVRPSSPEAYTAMREWLGRNAFPMRGATAPMMVLVGGRDNLVEPEWTEQASRAACAEGDRLDYRFRPEQGHADAAATTEAVDWVTERFLGTPSVNTCDLLS